MKVTIISKGKPIYEIERLAFELQKRDCEVVIVSPIFSLADTVTDTWWETLTATDILYYRTGLGDAPKAELAKRIVTKNIRCFNAAQLTNQLLSNKVHQAIQVLHARSVLVPATLFGRGHQYQRVVDQIGAPFVLKAAQGIQGQKVSLITNNTEYEQQVSDLTGDILMQKFIPNDGDFRVFVVGGVTQAIFKRVPKPGDFRANMSQGGSGESVEDEQLRAQLSHYAESVVRTLNLDIAGIDLMQDQQTKELYFIEANVNPGWKGLDTTLDMNMAAIIADYMLLRK